MMRILFSLSYVISCFAGYFYFSAPQSTDYVLHKNNTIVTIMEEGFCFLGGACTMLVAGGFTFTSQINFPFCEYVLMHAIV